MGSSSSSTQIANRYDVFLSFRGDTRYNFTSHLDSALRKSGLISTFKDENKFHKGKDKLQKGKDIEKQLMEAIEGSRYAVVVLSEEYADSDWCLKELARIVRCMGDSGRILPIFYHVNVSHVRNVKSTDVEKQKENRFWKALEKHAKNPSLSQYVESWKNALVKVADQHKDYVTAYT
ncbi:hypothetical protein FNV43_RR17874 [Rhamnella rubrinervis]|uniref:ADP-ribosyl cyclase/cyclic ADP-ribose hydrolase n=1 Tax=Rhamnella rubrinervis TaxID=2594499 RepID=A0A8K0DZN0_9ROSA|nr:hypothetical protein FNV43_RR17874 [Rhamnella rubrinervis]